jgi:Zn-dependent protease
MILVAAAGPGMNLLLATVAALAVHLVGYLPATAAQWAAANLGNALLINVILALFNLLPLLPLDGGRIVAGVLPRALAVPFSRIEPYGLPILIGLLFILPALGTRIGVNLDFISQGLSASTDFIVGGLLYLTGNAG